MSVIRKIDFAAYVTCGVMLLQILAVYGWRPYKIIISNITTETYSPKCRMNASFTFSDSTTFNIYVKFLKHIRNPFMHTDLYLESTNGKYDMELINHTVDYCKFLKTARFKPAVQIILKLFAEHLTHWFITCPLNKGVYYLKNVELNVEKLPPFFPEKSGIFKSMVLDKNERLYHLQISFQIMKTFKKKNSNDLMY